MIHMYFLPYWVLNLKRCLEQIIMFPFVVWGRLRYRHYLQQFQLDEDYEYILFFPGAGLGGAERVNADILGVLEDKKKLVILTKKSDKSIGLAALQKPQTTIIDISEWIDNKKMFWKNLIWRGVIAQYHSRELGKDTPIFIGQDNFGYKMTPHLGRSVRVTELIHMYDQQFSNVWIPFVSILDRRVVLSKGIEDTFLSVYRKKGIPKKYWDRFTVIPNQLPFKVPGYSTKFELPLHVIYVGRGGIQKRLWLYNQVILRTENLPLCYDMAGDFEDELLVPLPLNTQYHGKIKPEEMMQFYAGKHILLMTSSFEGFPFAIIESMAHGVIPVVTAVGEIPERIEHGKNGFLIENIEDEEAVVEQAVDILTTLTKDPELFDRMSRECHNYVSKHFSPEDFRKAYRRVLIFE